MLTLTVIYRLTVTNCLSEISIVWMDAGIFDLLFLFLGIRLIKLTLFTILCARFRISDDDDSNRKFEINFIVCSKQGRRRRQRKGHF